MTATEPQRTPYADAAADYWRAGWRGLLPLPHGQKAPVPTGWTGRDGAWPSWPDVQAWTEDRPASNLALRLPPDVIGIDVDHYDGKPGGLVLAQLEADHGALPDTWRTTSRDDGTSGIRLYRIPAGLRWPGVLGPGIETIRFEHRYAVTWPSIHPGGSTYRWIRPDGTTALHDVPSPDDLPDLPDAWVAHFTGGELATDQPKADLSDTAAGGWLAQRGAGPVCDGTARALARSLDIGSAGARHDAMLAGTNRLVWLAGEGHIGATTALQQLKAAFLAATAGDRAPAEADAEWGRAVAGAVRMAAAAHPEPSPDPCADPFAGLIPKESSCAPAATAPTSTTTPTPTSPSSTAEAAEPPTGSATPQPDDAPERTSWWPRDTDAALNDDTPEPPPTHLVRDDGQACFYAGRVNGLIGPSESGKTWLALLAIQQAAERGERVTVLDFEDTHRGVLGRLRSMGVDDDTLRGHVRYIGPDEAFHPLLPTGVDLAEHLEQWQPQLIVLDGFNAAMTLQGLDLLSNKDATVFAQQILKPLTKNNACVVYIDHTPKDKENASAGGIGAQAKRAMTTGCAIRVEVLTAFGKGQSGKLRLRVDKDRQGDVRGASLPGKAGHWVADAHIGSGDDGAVSIHLETPQAGAAAPGRPALRPTVLMERVSTFLATLPEGATQRAVRDGVKGKVEYVTQALDLLVEEGYASREESAGRGGTRLVHHHVKPYTEACELLPRSGSRSGSQVVPGTASSGSRGSGSPAPSPYGEPEPLHATHGPVGSADDAEVVPGTTNRVVTRSVAGKSVRVDLDTGEVVDA